MEECVSGHAHPLPGKGRAPLMPTSCPGWLGSPREWSQADCLPARSLTRLPLPAPGQVCRQAASALSWRGGGREAGGQCTTRPGGRGRWPSLILWNRCKRRLLWGVPEDEGSDTLKGQGAAVRPPGGRASLCQGPHKVAARWDGCAQRPGLRIPMIAESIQKLNWANIPSFCN